MEMTSKSYWQRISLEHDGAKETCMSWFTPLGEGLTPYKAEILCDIETDREKKLRVFATGKDGAKYQLERTRGKREFSISSKRIDVPVGAST